MTETGEAGERQVNRSPTLDRTLPTLANRPMPPPRDVGSAAPDRALGRRCTDTRPHRMRRWWALLGRSAVPDQARAGVRQTLLGRSAGAQQVRWRRSLGQSPAGWWESRSWSSMWSAGDGGLIGVSVARVVEEGHRGRGEVAAGDGPLVAGAGPALDRRRLAGAGPALGSPGSGARRRSADDARLVPVRRSPSAGRVLWAPRPAPGER